ncbi:sugar MFS transporter [Sphingomonas sp. BIUV-7]|uniref:Sugar MFS transporter n=1 Tax=Sphingomonas natans TaxID=3063330 RepID=A0ABT8Y421_9SPHN|nr:sugar MFS transporter [Sphingomonas sp. BIUV-7]MDO6413060.1 sugar MFS transporter [Sphingomonas sp. BIUV-7]
MTYSRDAAKSGSRSLVVLVIALFFIWGGATSLNDILIPKLKGLYALSYLEVMLTQFAFFTAYFIVSIPAGNLITRIGYLKGIVVGLVVTAAGALLFWPAAGSGIYASFLGALFVLAAGITILQVAANPFIASLGDERTASSRLTFAQAFNSLGTTVWPYVGSNIILAGTVGAVDPTTLSAAALPAYRVQESAIIAHVYVGIAIVLAVIALIFWLRRNAVGNERPVAVGFFDSLGLLREKRILFGVVALFCYVGAEVSIGSLMVNYLGQKDVMGLDPRAAGERLSLYWGGAMIGRFVGAVLLRRFEPGKLLATFCVATIALVLISMLSSGAIAGWSLLAVGLFNSIMFPTIFSLALEGQGKRTAEASGLLCMAIVGGAILPLVSGGIADVTSIATALVIPIICYVVIGIFGVSNPAKG